MIQKCHLILETILIDSFSDGMIRYGENFAALLIQDLNFEQKGKLLDLIGFEIIENSLPYIEDPENFVIDEDSFDYCVSKMILISEFKIPLGGLPKTHKLTGKHKRLYDYGKYLKSQAKIISNAANKQVAGSKNRLLGGGKGTIRDSLYSAGRFARTGTLKGVTKAAGNLIGAGYHALRGTAGLVTGGARKLLSSAVRSRGRQLQSLPYKQYAVQQKINKEINKAKEDIESRRSKYA